MKKYHKTRLLKLADYLDTIKPKKFNIYLVIRSYTVVSTAQYIGKTYREDCGTVACAMGYACIMPEFNKAGLDIRGFSNIEFKTKDITYHDSAAIEKFFGITSPERASLFYSSGYDTFRGSRNVTPKMVSKKIRKLVKEKENASVS